MHDSASNHGGLAAMQWFTRFVMEYSSSLLDARPDAHRHRSDPIVKQRPVDLSAVAEAASDIVVVVRVSDGSIRWISNSVTALTGWTPEELQDAGWHTLVHPAEHDRIRQMWRESAHRLVRVEHRLRTKASGYRWFNTSIRLLPQETDTEHAVISLQDIDDLTRSRLRSHWSEVALRGLFDSIPDPVSVWRPIRDDAGTCTDLLAVKTNRAFDATQGGFSSEGRTASAVAPLLLTLLPEIERTLERRGSHTVALPEHGRHAHLHLSSTDGNEVVIVSRDVTDLEAATELNRHAEMREDTYHLARVAHTLRTNLSVVQGWIEILDDEEHMRDPELSREAIASIARNTKNLIATVTTLMNAVMEPGQYSLSTTPIDISPVLEHLVTDLRASHRELQAELLVEPGIMVLGNEEAIDIAVRHLLENAARFAKTTVTLRAMRDGEHVLITVLDDGPGIAADVQLFRVFTPNHRGNGHGVGLNVVQKIADALHGSVDGRNRVDGPGAEFVLKLPAADQAESSSR